MTQDSTFGSNELTPEFVRGAQFTEVDGRIDASEVRTFLDRVASALDVFLSGDAQEALRKEFARNAEIAQQVLDAGQNASQQLRSQAAEDATRILDETREATERLRSDVEGELESSKRQVVEMRTRLMGDLRDLHDRIGASLYRFERAIEESPVDLTPSSAQAAQPESPAPTASASASVPAPAAEPAAPAVTEAPAPAPVAPAAPELAPLPSVDPIEVTGDVDLPDVSLPTGVPEPAWTQLPADIATPPTPELAPLPIENETVIAAPELPVTDPPEYDPLAPNPFAVVEDEPLAPGEPLIDLRDFSSQPLGDTSDDDRAAALLANLQESPAGVVDAPGEGELPAQAPPGAMPPAAATDVPPTAAADVPSADPTGVMPAAAADAAPAVPAASAPPVDVAAGDAWLPATYDDPLGAVAAPAPAAAPTAPGSVSYPPQLGQEAPSPVPAPTASHAAAAPAASPDAMAVRQLILESISAGQSREAIETYLRNNMGFVEPAALVDAALASMDQPSA